MRFKVEEANIASIVRAIDSRWITCEQLTRQYLERVEAFDKNGPRLNAIIAINQQAAEESKELDRRFHREGIVGPLHGVPVFLKDNFDVAGMATTAGCAALQQHYPSRDAFVVRRLWRAGAVILGKTNLHELAVGGTTMSTLGGQTRNPYDLTRTPGGSSGGSGAAVAASFCAAGLGSDTVNSVRSPASAQNLVGLRPTAGLLSRSGVVPVSPTQDAVGPMARSAEDAARLLDVMAGYDEDDPATVWSTGRAGESYLPAGNGDGLHGLRIGVCSSLFGDGAEHAEVSAVVLDALMVLERAGAKLIEIKNLNIDVAELIANVDMQRLEYKKAINAYLSRSDASSPVKSLAQLLETGNFIAPGVIDFLRRANAVDPASVAAEYEQRLSRIKGLQQKLMSLIANQRLDVLAYPLQKRLVVPIGSPEQSDRNGIIAALTGFPAIDFPAGFSSKTQTAPLGVPIGIDLLGRPWSERLLIRIAHSFENMTRFRHAPLSTSAL